MLATVVVILKNANKNSMSSREKTKRKKGICILNKNEDGFDINLYSPSFKRCRIGELTVI